MSVNFCHLGGYCRKAPVQLRSDDRINVQECLRLALGDPRDGFRMVTVAFPPDRSV